jgi:hypothetical protein
MRNTTAATLLILGLGVAQIRSDQLALKCVGSVEKFNGPVQVTVVFNKAVDATTAVALQNYSISGASITGAAMLQGLPAEEQLGNGENPLEGRVLDDQCVVLEVAGLSGGVQWLSVRGVRSQDLLETLGETLVAFAPSGYKWAEPGDATQPDYFTFSPPDKFLFRATLPGNVIAVGDNGFDIFSAGRAQWNNHDELTFVYKEVTDDFDLKARVAFQDYSSHWARAGLMMRETLNVGENDEVQATTASRYADIHANPVMSSHLGLDTIGYANNTFESHVRWNPGEYTGTSAGGTPLYPNAWVRLQRQGQIVRSYIGEDGVNWTLLAERDFGTSLAETVYVGPSYCPELWNIPDILGFWDRLYLAQIRFDVTDNTPPVITGFAATPNTLWPPNHKLVPVTIAFEASDASGIGSSWLSAASNEPDNGVADGDTAGDIQYVAGNPHLIYLRAERSGKGTGRVYTITLHCADFHGNSVAKSLQVKVPSH